MAWTDIDYEKLTEDVANYLRLAGLDARSEQTGGGVMCVFITIDDRREWIFGTANENWGGDVIDREDGSVYGEGTAEERHATTVIPSDSEDAEAIASQIVKAVL